MATIKSRVEKTRAGIDQFLRGKNVIQGPYAGQGPTAAFSQSLGKLRRTVTARPDEIGTRIGSVITSPTPGRVPAPHPSQNITIPRAQAVSRQVRLRGGISAPIVDQRTGIRR